MQDEIHFEIFYRTNAGNGWALHDACPKRDDAIKQANGLIASKRAGTVKVIKQTYNPKTSDYFSVRIFETGHASLTLDPGAEDLPPAAACSKPQDFYTAEARLVIARLLGEYLARQRLTASELLHRADALQAFESTDAVFQHAVQRIAVVQSAGTGTAVQNIIKNLNALVTEAMHRVYRDAARHYFPNTAPGGFGALASAAAPQSDGAYVFNGALARHLKSAGSWDGKVHLLLGVLDEAPQDEAGHALLTQSVDAMVEEILNGSSSLYELIGGHENLNATLAILAELLHGADHAAQTGQPGLAALTRCFAANRLPHARRAVANRILAELKSAKRLCPASIADEIKALRQVAGRLMEAAGKYLDPADLEAAFTLHSRRLVTREALTEITAAAMTPDEKLERLFFVLDNIVGAENKRRLASFLMPLISGGSFEGHCLAQRSSPAAALKRLAEHQARVQHGGFSDEQREDIASIFDRIAVQVEARSQFFKTIEAKSSNTVDRAMAYLDLCDGGVTEGRLATRARKAALGYIAKPDFMAGFAARLARGAGSHDAKAELTALLKKAGLNPGEVFASQAA